MTVEMVNFKVEVSADESTLPDLFNMIILPNEYTTLKRL